MTRIILIMLMWVLLGVLFFTIKKNCCSNQPAILMVPATSETDQSVDPHSDLPKADEVSVSDSELTNETAVADSQNKTSESSETNFEYDEFSTIRSEDDKSIIPFSEDNNLSTEVQALLEETCARLSTSLAKVQITAYGEDRSNYLRKMEDFLIRCGLSPGRVDLSSRGKNDTYEDKIVLQVL